MPVSVTEVLGIGKASFKATGALDALLDMDSCLYLDPHLLEDSDAAELKGSYDTFRKRFADLLKVLHQSRERGDRFWRAADEMLDFPEVPGLCLGYGKSGTRGSGMGPELRARLLHTAKLIVDAGIEDPEIFELVGLFEEDIGPDRVSDMTARVIRSHLYSYSHAIFQKLSLTPAETINVDGWELPRNPFSGEPIILVPKDVLKPLPVAEYWTDVDVITAQNRELRDRLNDTVGNTWRKARSNLSKSDFKRLLLEHPELIKNLLAKYKGKPRSKHDYAAEPYGEPRWHELAKEMVAGYPLSLALSEAPDQAELLRVVTAICDKFREHIELHGANKLLYRPDGKPYHERVAQVLFYMVADVYCEANNLGLSREPNAGRGAVDFTIDIGYKLRVVVEIKLSTNRNLVHGLEIQIEEYRKAEHSYASVFIVIDTGNPGDWLPRLKDKVNSLNTDATVPDVRVIDGRVKASASKTQ